MADEVNFSIEEAQPIDFNITEETPVNFTIDAGRLDEPSIYNRALSSTEIENKYKAESTNKPYLEGAETEVTNSAPNKPFNPNPSDTATGVSTTTTLSVNLTDPDGDTMNASFYWSNDTLIEKVTSVSNGSTATTSSLSLSGETTYNWYVNATDGSLTNSSNTWSFTTESAQCWIEEPGKLRIPPGCKYYKDISEGIAPSS